MSKCSSRLLTLCAVLMFSLTCLAQTKTPQINSINPLTQEASPVVEILGKSFLHHPPPPFMFFRYDLGFQFPTSYVQTGNSYPSGHAMRMVFLLIVGSFILFHMKKFKICMYYNIQTRLDSRTNSYRRDIVFNI